MTYYTVMCTWCEMFGSISSVILQAKSEQEAKTSCEEYSLVASSRSGPTPSDHAPTSHAEDEDDVISMPLIVKGDVMGSVEALVHCLTARQPQGVRLKVIHSGVGPISDGDMDMALSTKGTPACGASGIWETSLALEIGGCPLAY